MAKVFSLVLVVLVLASSVLLFAIPTQEQPANAYVNNDTNIMQYQVDNTTSFENIPGTTSVGYKFQFDFDSGYVPFYVLVVSLKSSTGEMLNAFEIRCQYYGGTLHLFSVVLGMDIEYSTSLPCRLELIMGRSAQVNFRLHVLINTKYLGYYDCGTSELITRYNIYFLDTSLEPYDYDFWKNAPFSQLAVHYSSIRANEMSVYRRSWIIDGGYDAGYIDGMNDANDAKASLFPSIIGSIFAFFVSIASYEVLGISLLNIMIIVGSVLLLLAILRVFLK